MIRSRSLLVALIAGGLGAATLQAVHAANPSQPAGLPSVQKLDDDQYPHMRRALHDLRAARESLDAAEPRFKGHRDKAIEHVDQAIQQCVDALAEG
jgi:ABC-type sugar transport system substrate-binding protein